MKTLHSLKSSKVKFALQLQRIIMGAKYCNPELELTVYIHPINFTIYWEHRNSRRSQMHESDRRYYLNMWRAIPSNSSYAVFSPDMIKEIKITEDY